MRPKQKALFISLSFIGGLEFILLKLKFLDLLGIFSLIGLFSLVLALEIFWIFGKFRLQDFLSETPYLILPLAFFWGTVFLIFSLPGVFLQQVAIFSSAFLLYLIGWSFSRDRQSSQIAFNILSFSTMLVAFLLYSLIWFFYLSFNFPSWILNLLVFFTSLLLFYQMFNLCFKLTSHLFVYQIIFALILLEVSWTLTFWPGEHPLKYPLHLSFGLLLTSIFYLLWGVFSHQQEGRLTGKIIFEYFIFVIIIIGVILKFTPFLAFLKQ